MLGEIAYTGAKPHAKRLALCAAIAIVMALSLASLAGCKYSSVLTQHLEDPELGVLDETQEPTFKNNPDAEERPDLIDTSISDSDDENTQVAVLPHYDPAAPDNGPTPQRLKSPETPHEEEASEGQEEGEPDREGTGEGESGGEETNSNEGDSEEGDEEGEGENLDEETGEAVESEEGGGAGETVVVDPEQGTTDDTAKGTIAAVGEYATIAQMLGGAGALSACDQSWLDARGDDGAFKGELERVQVAFSGDGSASGSCDVDLLVKTVQPSVVLWDSSANMPALSEKERASLEEAGITVQAVPHIGEQNTEDYEVKAAVAEVASVLKGADGLQFDPADVLTKYNEFHDAVLKGCYDANKGYSYKVTDGSYASLYQNTPLTGLSDSTTTRVTTVYVDEMRDFGATAKVSQTATVTGGTIRLAHDGETLDISDGVAMSAAVNTRSYMLIDYYLQLAGVMNNAYDAAQPDSQGRRYILMPGETSSFGTSGKYASRSTASAFFYNSGDATVQGNWHKLSDADFGTVLVASKDIAKAFVSSAEKSNGLYHMESPYDVVVVPTGIGGAWSEGHIDSFLLAPWAFRIQNYDNLEAASSYASGFYSTFLRCSDWESAVDNWDNSKTAG